MFLCVINKVSERFMMKDVVVMFMEIRDIDVGCLEIDKIKDGSCGSKEL